jgi:hypothetical protein
MANWATNPMNIMNPASPLRSNINQGSRGKNAEFDESEDESPKARKRAIKKQEDETKAYFKTKEGKEEIRENTRRSNEIKRDAADYKKHGKMIHGTGDPLSDTLMRDENSKKFAKKSSLMDKVKSVLPQFKKGGKVKRTGKALVHKGEVVLNKKQQQKVGPAKVKKAIEPTVADYRKKN